MAGMRKAESGHLCRAKGKETVGVVFVHCVDIFGWEGGPPPRPRDAITFPNTLQDAVAAAHLQPRSLNTLIFVVAAHVVLSITLPWLLIRDALVDY